MNWNGMIVLSCIEEDNTQKAYFRVRPLMTELGAVSAEELAEYQDEGYLRVVPDKNEQHTFKERMRSLGRYCVLNLVNVKPDFNKIRINKNYAPQKGEVNRYIVYSDAVQNVKGTLFFDVVSSDGISSALTPFVFVRNGAVITGPVSAVTGEVFGEQEQIPPDSSLLHPLTLPDGTEHLIYWPQKQTNTPAAKPAPAKEERNTEAEEKKEMAAAEDPTSSPENQNAEKKPQTEQSEKKEVKPDDAIDIIRQINENARPEGNLLKLSPQEQKTEVLPPVQRDQKLTGTPLYQPGMRQSMALRPHNALSEAVERQRYAARYESTGADLAANAKLQKTDNPVERFSSVLEEVWQADDTRERITEIVLATPGMRQMISRKCASPAENLTVNAVKEQLQEMEAERLMQLMRLDELKKDREKLFSEATAEAKKEADQLLKESSTQLESLSSRLTEMEAEAKKLSQQRDELAGAIEALNDGSETHLYRPDGVTAGADEMILRVKDQMSAAGFAADRNMAASMLLAKLICRDITVVSEQYDDAVLAAETFLKALGAKAGNTDEGCIRVLTGGNGFMASYGAARAQKGVDHVFTGNGKADTEPCLPVFSLEQDLNRIPESTACGDAVNEFALLKEVLRNENELPAPCIEWMKRVRKAVNGRICAAQMMKMKRFIGVSQRYLEGGLPAAMAMAVRIFALPCVGNNTDKALLKECVNGLPGEWKIR